MTWWWLPLALALPGFFLWATVHEGAHALAAFITGRRVTAFEPWPHRTPNGNFAFAWMAYEGGPGTAISIAPFVVDAIAFAAAAVGFWFVVHPAAALGLATTMALPAVNSLVGVLGRYRQAHPTDLSELGWKVATPFLFLAIAYWAVLGAAVFRLLSW